jgi:hypothetical protein
VVVKVVPLGGASAAAAFHDAFLDLRLGGPGGPLSAHRTRLPLASSQAALRFPCPTLLGAVLSGRVLARAAVFPDPAFTADVHALVAGEGWAQRWVGGAAALVLVRARWSPSEEDRLAADLALCGRRLAAVRRRRDEAQPAVGRLVARSADALRASLADAAARLQARDQSLLEWWADLGPQTRRRAGLVGCASAALTVVLAFGLGADHPVGVRARAVVLFVQAAGLWELSSLASTADAQQALLAAVNLDPKLVTVAATVAKIAVTAAVFQASLAWFGGAGLGGSGAGSGAAPLVWVWFFGILTGHLVFGRLAQSEALQYLHVDLDAARLAVDAADAAAALEAAAAAMADSNEPYQSLLEESAIADPPRS